MVDSGNRFPKIRGPRRFGVAAPVLEEAVVSAWLQIEELLDRAGLGIGAGEQISGGEFVFAEILLDTKRFDLHAKESGKPCVPESRTKLTGRPASHANREIAVPRAVDAGAIWRAGGYDTRLEVPNTTK